MDRAINHIKSFQATGTVPPAIEKARERTKRLKEIRESSEEGSESFENVSLEDVASTLKKQTVQPSETPLETVESKPASMADQKPAMESSSLDEMAATTESLRVPEPELPGGGSPEAGPYHKELPQQELEPKITDSSYPMDRMAEDSDLSSSIEESTDDYSDLLPAMSPGEDHAAAQESLPSLDDSASGIMDSQSIDASSYDDLLPPMTGEVEGEQGLHPTGPVPALDAIQESQVSDFDDLLPANDGVGVEFMPPAEGFDDLLPSMGEADSHDDLLPNLGETDSPGGDYDDLLPPLESSEGGAQDYDDLLPPLQDSGSVDTYDDLLPPLQEGSSGSGDYDDLLPPLQGASSTDAYDDLLPPMRAGDGPEPQSMGGEGLDLDDLLPPMKPEGEGPEGRN